MKNKEIASKMRHINNLSVTCLVGDYSHDNRAFVIGEFTYPEPGI